MEGYAFLFRENRLPELHYCGPDASLDTDINDQATSMSLWPLWQYRHNGHIRDVAIVAIAAIVDPGH